MPADKRTDSDPTLALLRRFRPLWIVGLVAFIIVPRVPDLFSSEAQTQVGAGLAIGYYSCLTWALWNMSSNNNARYWWLMTVVFGVWEVVFLAFYAWLWTTFGFDPGHLLTLFLGLAIPVASAAAYRRVRRDADE